MEHTWLGIRRQGPNPGSSPASCVTWEKSLSLFNSQCELSGRIRCPSSLLFISRTHRLYQDQIPTHTSLGPQQFKETEFSYNGLLTKTFRGHSTQGWPPVTLQHISLHCFFKGLSPYLFSICICLLAIREREHTSFLSCSSLFPQGLVLQLILLNEWVNGWAALSWLKFQRWVTHWIFSRSESTQKWMLVITAEMKREA